MSTPAKAKPTPKARLKPKQASILSQPAPPDTLTESPNGPLTPEARAYDEPVGIPFVLGDGQTWIIARVGLAKGMSEVRDSVYATRVTKNLITYADTMSALWYGLASNYCMTSDELDTLVSSTDFDLVYEEACKVALPWPSIHREFTHWARASLIICGIDPSSVLAADLPHVLDLLVLMNKTVDPSAWTDAGMAGAKFAGLRNAAAQLAQPKIPPALHPLLATE
jgi:hypothetical protein